MTTFDAIILADSPHADTVLLGLSLVERARRVAVRAGARNVIVVRDDRTAIASDADVLVIRGGDQLVHHPLPKVVVGGSADRRIAVGPDGEYAGALYASGDAAREVINALRAGRDDRAIASSWTDAERLVHGDIARHPATTRDEQRAAVKMLLRILTKADEDSPVSKYIYRPVSKPITRALLHTSITPNQVTVVVGIIGLIGCFLTALPGQSMLIWGAALVFASGILDGCDGEIARLKITSSPLGAWLDTIVDEITSVAYFVAIGIHTYQLHPEPWIGGTVALGTLGYLASIYGIYYFCIVVLKAGGSQYYVGTLDVVESQSGVGLKARARAPSNLPKWMLVLGQWALYVIRRDFINLAAFILALFNLYAVIYTGIFVGAIVSGAIIAREHIRLRAQLREVARRGGSPRLVT